MTIRQEVEHFVDTDGNFSMHRLADVVWPLIESLPNVSDEVQQLKRLLNTNYKKLTFSILRNVFLIELAKVPKIETTKFRVRWFDLLRGDPRYCPFDECMSIATELLKTLPLWLQSPDHSESMNLSFSTGLIPYETPLDYKHRLSAQGRLHQPGNLIWVCDELILRTLKLRKYLLNSSTSPDHIFFQKVLKDKIKVKTYLTDRVLTGNYKTNREKRWETHPNSVHFAVRRECMKIEYELITQVCSFDGFPQESISQLQRVNILPQNISPALCPITGDKLSFEVFRSEILQPTHGVSKFQVGHMNPLKHGDDGEANGHIDKNISWISADGNRIQGSLSLRDVRRLIQRISQNYASHGWDS